MGRCPSYILHHWTVAHAEELNEGLTPFGRLNQPSTFNLFVSPSRFHALDPPPSTCIRHTPCQQSERGWPRRKDVLLHVPTWGDQHKKRRKKVARQWPKRPEVPFSYKEYNAKTTRGWDTDK